MYLSYVNVECNQTCKLVQGLTKYGYSRSRPIIEVTADVMLEPDIINLDEKRCSLKDGTAVVWYDQSLYTIELCHLDVLHFVIEESPSCTTKCGCIGLMLFHYLSCLGAIICNINICFGICMQSL